MIRLCFQAERGSSYQQVAVGPGGRDQRDKEQAAAQAFSKLQADMAFEELHGWKLENRHDRQPKPMQVVDGRVDRVTALCGARSIDGAQCTGVGAVCVYGCLRLREIAHSYTSIHYSETDNPWLCELPQY